MIIKNIAVDKVNEDVLALSSQYLEFWKDKFILVSLYTNMIYVVDRSNYRMELVISLPYADQRRDLYRFFTLYKDDLILVPYAAKYFLKVDLNTGNITEVDGILTEQEKKFRYKFLFGVITDNHLWCIGEDIAKIICVNLDNLCVEEVKCFHDRLSTVRWSDVHAVVDDTILIPSRNSNVILEVNDTSKAIKLFELDESSKNNGFLDIVWFDGEIHLYDDKGLEYVWNRENNTLKYLFRKEAEGENFASRQILSYGDDFFRIALYENCIYKYIRNGEIYKICIIDENIELKDRIAHFHNGKMEGRYIYIQSRYGYLYRLDMEKLEVEKIQIRHENITQTAKEIIREALETKIIGEGEMGSLEQYIQWIEAGYGCIAKESSEQVGVRIYGQFA